MFFVRSQQISRLLFLGMITACASPELIHTRQDVFKALEQESVKFQECGELAVARKSGEALDGRVVLSWTIDAAGFARNVTTNENTTKDDVLAECLASKIENIKFPANTNVGEVQFPFDFQK